MEILCWTQWTLNRTFSFKEEKWPQPYSFERIWLNALSWRLAQQSYSNLRKQSWGALNTIAEAFFVRLRGLLLHSQEERVLADAEAAGQP